MREDTMKQEEKQQQSMKRTVIEGKGIPLRGDDIDTDRIIPARYLKCVTFDDLGAFAFYDERYNPDGSEKPHPFNDPAYRGGEILIVNKNFGCGSSREHAPQSLMRMGIRAVVGESFAEIFAGNATALGIPTIRADEADIKRLMEAVERSPDVVRVDLESNTVEVPAEDVRIPTSMPESYRKSLMTGTWDTTAALLAHREEIEQVRNSLPYIVGY